MKEANLINEDDYLRLMRSGWAGGLRYGTPCGKGSALPSTVNIRARLPELVKEYGIKTVCDAGAGDLHWLKTVEWDVGYAGFDIHPRHPSVKRLDIRKEPLPACDLILCRQVLGHMNPEWVLQALALFRRSGKYLLATQHDTPVNELVRLDTYNRYNLMAEPFSLGDPLEVIPDGETSPEKKRFSLCLWRLQ